MMPETVAMDRLKDFASAPVVRAGGSDYARVARALERLATRFPEHPSLAELAREAGLSEHHFQRLFTAWAGVSPKKFLQYLSLEAAKERLRQSASVLDAAYDAGFSGPGRMHDLFVTAEAVTPGEYKARGEGIVIRYGYHDSPFGECLLMTTERGVCGLAFVDDAGRDALLAALSRGWDRARLEHDESATAPVADAVFQPPPRRPGRDAGPLRLLLRGTRFQLKVWQALLSMPQGTLTTYRDLARRLGLGPSAARAVGNANSTNAVSWLIPCHRVIRMTGAMGGYRWGEARKLAMIGWEAAAAERAGQSSLVQGSTPPQAMNGGLA